jgi:hypothetical protein
MSAIISTATGTGQNCSAECKLGNAAIFTASGVQTVALQPRVSNLTNTASNITFRLEHTLGNGTVLAYQADIETRAKDTATNIAYGSRWLGPVALKDGEILNLYCLSSNTVNPDTNVSYSVDVINVLAADLISILGSLLTGTASYLSAAFSTLFNINASTATVTHISNIGTPIAIDGGAATLAGNLTKIADDNGGASYDATINSLNKITTTIVTGLPSYAHADTQAANGGVVTTGVSIVLVTLNNASAGETWKLTINGVNTSALAYNASATDVGNAIRTADPTLVGYLTVSGSLGGPYTVTISSGKYPTIVAGACTGDLTITLTNNGYADATWLDNGTYWQLASVSPAVGGYGLDAHIVFSLGTAHASTVRINAKETMAGATGTVVHVFAYNYTTGLFDQLSDTASVITGSSDANYAYALLKEHQNAAGEVKIGFRSTNTAGNFLYIDQIIIDTVLAGSGNYTLGEISNAVWQHPISAHDNHVSAGFYCSRPVIQIGDVVSANGAVLTISGLRQVNDIYNGLVCTLHDEVNDVYEIRNILDCVINGGNLDVTLDRIPYSTVTTDWDIYIGSTMLIGEQGVTLASTQSLYAPELTGAASTAASVVTDYLDAMTIDANVSEILGTTLEDASDGTIADAVSKFFGDDAIDIPVASELAKTDTLMSLRKEDIFIVTLSGGTHGNTWTLTVDGVETTPAFSHDPSAATVQTALNTANGGGTAIVVTGDSGGPYRVVVTGETIVLAEGNTTGAIHATVAKTQTAGAYSGQEIQNDIDLVLKTSEFNADMTVLVNSVVSMDLATGTDVTTSEGVITTLLGTPAQAGEAAAAATTVTNYIDTSMIALQKEDIFEVTLNNASIGETWKLKVDGTGGAALPYNASASAVETDLNTTFGIAVFSVTGNDGGPYRVVPVEVTITLTAGTCTGDLTLTITQTQTAGACTGQDILNAIDPKATTVNVTTSTTAINAHTDVAVATIPALVTSDVLAIPANKLLTDTNGYVTAIRGNGTAKVTIPVQTAGGVGIVGALVSIAVDSLGATVIDTQDTDAFGNAVFYLIAGETYWYQITDDDYETTDWTAFVAVAD